MIKKRLIALLITFTTLCFSSPILADQIYEADMEVRLPGATSYARIYAKPGFLRMNVKGGRTASGMIAHYRKGMAYALIPSTSEYREFPIESLRDRVPHFFDPALKTISRKKLSQEQIQGQLANKYSVTLKNTSGRTYEGYLWESVDLENYPLQWKDSKSQITAIFHNGKLVNKPDDFFLLPDGYSEQVVSQQTPPLKQHCKSRRNKSSEPSQEQGAQQESTLP